MRLPNLRRPSAPIFVALACWAGAAKAENTTPNRPFTVALRYAVAADCPTQRDFEAIVVKRLGADPFSEQVGPRVFVFIAPGDTQLEGHVVWHDQLGNWAGDQTFPSKTNNCTELVAAMGFAVAVQIQLLSPHSARGSGDKSAAAPSTLPSSSRAPPSPEKARASSDKGSKPRNVELTRVPAVARSSATLATDAGISLAFAMAAEPIALGRVGGVLFWPRVSLELAGEASLPAITRRADRAGFSQRYLLLSTAVCGREWQWSACSVVKAGQVRVDGRDVDAPRASSSAFIQAGVRAAVTQSIGPGAYLAARAEGLVTLTRWTGTLDDVPVWTAPRLAYTVGLDLGVLLR